MRYIQEDFDPSINVEGGSIDINDDAVEDAINRYLSAVTARSVVTPYIALEKIRKILAYYKIFIPQTVFLEGDEGNEVFEISQFGDKMGMTDDGEVKVNDSDGLYLYFEWMMNEEGLFDIFSEIVDEEELDELLADFDDEGEDEGNDDSDGAEPSHDMYKAANMKEDYDKDWANETKHTKNILSGARKKSDKKKWKSFVKDANKRATTGMSGKHEGEKRVDEEQLDELKMDKKTYVAAMKRATDYEADYAGDANRIDTDKLIARAKKYKGAKFAKQLAGADQMTSRPNRNKVAGQWGSDQLSWRKPSRKTKSGKANKTDLQSLKASLKKGDYRKPKFSKRKLPKE